MPADPEQKSGLDKRDSPGLRLLVVDDNHANRVLMQALLNGLGFEPEIVGNGVDAVKAANDARFDLIFMDVRMPGLDGLEATRRLRCGSGASRDAQIVALTAHCDRDDLESCCRAGMDTVITKPICTSRLARILSDAAGSAVTGQGSRST